MQKWKILFEKVLEKILIKKNILEIFYQKIFFLLFFISKS